MKWMQHTCRQAAELMSLQRDQPLGLWRAVGLKLHLRVCGDCREVDKQLDQLSDLSAGLWGRATHAASDDEPDQR